MIIDKTRVQDRVLLTIQGIIRLGQSAESLEQSLKRTLDRDEGDVMIDLSRINYIDSTGIGELVGYLGKFAERGRRLILISPSPRIENLLRVAQIHSFFPTYPTLEAALAGEKPAAAG